eukprot:TRINITY_DN5186_c0_g1_i2.p1 TRINITY_DN5186_c0_g1~~TRINITY_DN5186_c0_g1_i2.p1  ORF type:complete len:389 (-),score=78.67 TRINITY_DN5186_c0_g1_i2:536-1663(-)
MALEEIYLRRLETLTINSKPIITSLTIIADENKNHASAEVARAVFRRAALLHPADQARLPLLYLIDSIVKNIGEPYITLFVPEIPRLFNETFAHCQVDKTRLSMIKLLNTWRDPKLRFPPSLFQIIDAHVRSTPRIVSGAPKRPPDANYPAAAYHGAIPPPEKRPRTDHYPPAPMPSSSYQYPGIPNIPDVIAAAFNGSFAPPPPGNHYANAGYAPVVQAPPPVPAAPPVQLPSIDPDVWFQFVRCIKDLENSDQASHVMDVRNLNALVADMDRLLKSGMVPEHPLRIIEEVLISAAQRTPRLFADGSIGLKALFSVRSVLQALRLPYSPANSSFTIPQVAQEIKNHITPLKRGSVEMPPLRGQKINFNPDRLKT